MKKIIYFLFFIISFLCINITKSDAISIKNIDALSAIVIDGKTGKILFAKNPYLKIPPASTTKLVTAMVVLDNLSLSQKVKISRRAAKAPYSTPKIYPGEIYTVRDLLYLMLMESSNQAAVALAEKVAGSERKFTILMNKKIQSLGLKNSHFTTASGLPSPNQYTTSYDLAAIFYEALKYPIIKEIINTRATIIMSQAGRILTLRNTNKLLKDKHLEDSIIGGKTGFTKASKHCLVNGVYLKNRLIITSVLGAPKRKSLWKDTKALINFAKLVLENKATPLYIITIANNDALINKLKRKYRKYHRKKIS